MKPAEERGVDPSVREVLGVLVARPEEFSSWPAAQQDFALRVARRARLLGRLAAALESREIRGQLPEIIQDQLQSARVSAAARERLALWELDRIAWATRHAPAIRLVALKGAAYLLLDLPNAPGRIFADVDLMTDEGRLEETEELLNSRGWKTQELTPYDQNYYRNWTHELPPLVHVEREMEIDLHHNVLPRTARLKPDGARLMESSRSVPGSRYRVLANEDLVLHAMTHLFYGDDLSDKFRDLVDIRDLVLHFSAEDAGFWDRLIERAGVLDLRRPAWYGLRYIERLLDMTVPSDVSARIQRWGPSGVVRWLMDWLVPAALFPWHPDRPERSAGLSRFLLYVRSHWIRMPPWLLVYHLGYKLVVTRLPGRRKGRHA